MKGQCFERSDGGDLDVTITPISIPDATLASLTPIVYKVKIG